MADLIRSEIRIPADLAAWADKEAKRRRVSRNTLILLALEALRDDSPSAPRVSSSAVVDFPED